VKLESVCCVGGEAAPVDRANELFVRRVNLTVVQQAVQLLRRVTAYLKCKENVFFVVVGLPRLASFIFFLFPM
jgi:hypothetical protein